MRRRPGDERRRGGGEGGRLRRGGVGDRRLRGGEAPLRRPGLGLRRGGDGGLHGVRKIRHHPCCCIITTFHPPSLNNSILSTAELLEDSGLASGEPIVVPFTYHFITKCLAPS